MGSYCRKENGLIHWNVIYKIMSFSFKDWITQIFNKISNFIKNAKSLVIGSAKVGKGVVNFKFPAPIMEDVENDNYKDVASAAGFLFEMECYLAILAMGFKDFNSSFDRNKYNEFKTKVGNLYNLILSDAKDLANKIVSKSQELMSCVNAVKFNGGVSNNRNSTADIQMICDDYNEYGPINLGYSLKYKKEGNNSFTLATFTPNTMCRYVQCNGQKNWMDVFADSITNAEQFTSFLNKLISENQQVLGAIGGKNSGFLHDVLSQYFTLDNTKLSIIDNSIPVEVHDTSPTTLKFSLGKVILTVTNKGERISVTLSVKTK